MNIMSSICNTLNGNSDPDNNTGLSVEKLGKSNFSTEKPLPVPKWSAKISGIYVIKSQEDFNTLLELLQQKLSNSLEDLRYDTVANVLQFYRYFKQEHGTFFEKYRRYEPKLPSDCHDCIGLVLELQKSFKSLEKKFPNINNNFFIASCQENLKRIPMYTKILTDIFEFKDLNSDSQKLLNFDKEHVVLCLKFELEFSNRKGTFIFDPGFHVAKVVITMEDGFFPHTGWFVQKEEENFIKYYEYSYSEGTKDFINWHEKTIKGGTEMKVVNVIYTGRPFLSSNEVTEKRNLVYFFKSLLSRDKTGSVLAGIYFKIEIEREEFTVLYYNKNAKQRIKLKFVEIKEDTAQINKQVLDHLELCSQQLKMPASNLINILLEVKEMINDKIFVEGLLEVEEYISKEISGLWSLEDPDHVYTP